MQALRRHRAWLSRGLALVLLFAQLATAAYACPQLSGAEAPAVQAAAAMPDCAGNMPSGMDPEQPQLCKAHCEADQTSVNSQLAAPDVPVAVGAALPGVVDLADAAVQRVARMRAVASAGPPDGAPALYLAFLVLRN